MQAEIITIGDELLIGQVVDTNSAWMGSALNLIGLKVKQITSCSDDEKHIIESLTAAQKRSDIVFITGGLGPTKDDITKKTLSKYFNMPMRRDLATLRHVERIFEQFKRPMLDVNKMQADVPDGCTVILNKQGTAPCMWFEKDGKVVVSMPGVPFEMMYLMEEEIIPRIKAKYKLPAIIHKTILTANIGESYLAQRIAAIEDSLPDHIKLAYLPKLGQLRLRLSGTGWDEAALKDEIAFYAAAIIAEVNEFVIADEDIALEKTVLNFMEQRALTLSTAESCTGGYIAHLITQHPGSSAVYQGGAITYANSVKQHTLGVKKETLEAFGAVSEQTVCEMARGAVRQFRTDYAVAVSGIAGPDGGTEEKPVGTVWIAVASTTTVTAKVFTFSNKRKQVIERAATAALSMLFIQLKKEHI